MASKGDNYKSNEYKSSNNLNKSNDKNGNSERNENKRLVIKSGDEEFKVMLNPLNFSKKDAINYTPSVHSQSAKFKRYEKTTFKIPKIILDTTGVVPVKEWPLNGSIKQMIEKLEKVVYNMKGENHEPSIADVQWGSTHFVGRLESMDVNYVLFDVDGDPLRAEINLVFCNYKTIKELEAEANKSSPDLTHVIEVKSGDTLPNLCNKVYKDPSYYMQVARINGLSNFRFLKPGSRLVFPPLVD